MHVENNTIASQLLDLQFSRSRSSKCRYPLPPQSFMGNSVDEKPGTERYEITVQTYERQYEVLFERMMSSGIDIESLLQLPNIEIAHVCCGLPAKVEGLYRLLKKRGISIKPDQIINVDISEEVQTSHSTHELTARMRFVKSSVFDFLHSYQPEDKIVVAIAVTVTGIVVVQVAQHISKYAGKESGIKFGFLTTQQVTEDADPYGYQKYQDYQTVCQWRARYGDRSEAEIIDFMQYSSRYTDEFLYFVRQKKLNDGQ